MKSELERTKEALDALMCRFRSIAGYMDLTAAQRETESILNPAPIMEEVEEIVGWVNVYQKPDGAPYISDIHNSEANADDCAEIDRVSCQPIKVTVSREKKQPVERSVCGKITWKHREGFTFPVGHAIDFDWDTLVHRTGTLTFTWEESP